MTWFFTRIYKKIPQMCFAHLYLPNSIMVECDCILRCKFPPKGNNPILIKSCNNHVQGLEDFEKIHIMMIDRQLKK